MQILLVVDWYYLQQIEREQVQFVPDQVKNSFFELIDFCQPITSIESDWLFHIACSVLVVWGCGQQLTYELTKHITPFVLTSKQQGNHSQRLYTGHFKIGKGQWCKRIRQEIIMTKFNYSRTQQKMQEHPAFSHVHFNTGNGITVPILIA